MIKQLDAALDSVLRRASARGDTEIIEAYQHIYQQKKTRTDARAALRLGMLLGSEMVRREHRLSPRARKPKTLPRGMTAVYPK